eukprot:3132922-Prymnesium_polylepis.1
MHVPLSPASRRPDGRHAMRSRATRVGCARGDCDWGVRCAVGYGKAEAASRPELRAHRIRH